MQTFTAVIWSSVGRKILNGLTGLLLSAFILVHLIENYLLFSGPETYNLYVYRLTSLGGILYFLEILLLAVFLVHIISAVTVWFSKLRARPEPYTVLKSAGRVSRQTIFSKTMIYTGLLIFIFLVLHLITFKYGPHYSVTYHGREVRDMYRLVVEVFSRGGYVLWYEVLMILIGFHLRHGFWSAFQSLGLNHPKYNPVIFAFGYLFAIVIAVGFLAIPLWVYYSGGVQ
jgi:succinate dehydrogenase / fumarate reductase cytochrome b subunit